MTGWPHPGNTTSFVALEKCVLPARQIGLSPSQLPFPRPSYLLPSSRCVKDIITNLNCKPFSQANLPRSKLNGSLWWRRKICKLSATARLVNLGLVEYSLCFSCFLLSVATSLLAVRFPWKKKVLQSFHVSFPFRASSNIVWYLFRVFICEWRETELAVTVIL